MKRKRTWFFLCLLGCTVIAADQGLCQKATSKQIITETTTTGGGQLNQLFLLRDYQSKRASSWDTTGGNKDWITIEAGKSRTLLNERGAGCIKHFYWVYIEGDEREDRRLNLFHGVVLRAFWDGADQPSIEVPLGDFFGVSNDQVRPIRSLAFTANPGMISASQNTWGFNCYLAMPFAQGALIELHNQGDVEANLWFHIDYERYDRATVLPANVGRLHAHWNRMNPTKKAVAEGDPLNLANLTGRDNYPILQIEGNGQFVGYFLTVVNFEHAWWGEGDDMVFIDGETFPPSIHGTGTEEIFGGGACPSQEYTGPYTGFHCVENRSSYPFHGTNGMYRFYFTDPIRFKKSITVSLEHGHANDKANDYSSVAFWYQEGSNRKLKRLPALTERMTIKLSAPEIESTPQAFLDTLKVVFQPSQQGAEIYYTLDGSEPTVASTRYVQPIRLDRTTTIRARAFKPGQTPSDISVFNFLKTDFRQPDHPADLVNGLEVRYYEGQWDRMPDFSKLIPIKSGVVDQFDFAPVQRLDHFALEYSGFIEIPAQGVYTFSLMSDDGSRLYIGDRLVVDHDGLHRVSEKSGPIALAAGRHALKVEYFESLVHEILRVYYSGPGIEKRPIPGNVLFHSKK